MDIHHPSQNVPGQMGRFVTQEDGRQAYISWARSQAENTLQAGEICRRPGGDVAVFLGREQGNDYFMHILGDELRDAVAIDLENEEVIYDSHDPPQEERSRRDPNDRRVVMLA